MSKTVFTKRGESYVATFVDNKVTGEAQAKQIHDVLAAQGAHPETHPIIGGDFTGSTVTVPASDADIVREAGFKVRDKDFSAAKPESAIIKHASPLDSDKPIHPNQGRTVY